MRSVVILGAIHNDVVVDAPRIPRRDETLLGTGVDYRFGGKGGNQALAAARMGARVSMIGRVGRDDAGRAALAALDAAAVDRSGVAEVDRPTGMSVAISLPDGEYAAVIVPGANLDNDGAGRSAIGATDVSLIQNEVPEAANERFVRDLPDGCTLIWNAAPARDWNATVGQRTDILLVNRVEAADLSGLRDPERSAPALAQRVRGRAIVTLGGDGLIVAEGSGCSRVPGVPVPVRSTHGAGDMFAGAMAARLAAGDDLAQAIDFARHAASLFVAAEVGARASITADHVQAAMAGQSVTP